MFSGFTKCAICNEVIEASDESTGFPAFVPYDHKYGLFSDAALHKSCYEKHPDKSEVDAMYMAFRMIFDSRPKNLKKLDEIEEWHRQAFKNWPPKNGVVIFEPMFPDESPEEGFFMDVDDYNAMCEAENQHEQEQKVLRDESRRIGRDAWRYSRDD